MQPLKQLYRQTTQVLCIYVKANLALVLEAREKKLIDVSRENMQLREELDAYANRVQDLSLKIGESNEREQQLQAKCDKIAEVSQ